MYQQLSNEELDFIEDINFSICAAEVLFSNVDNMTLMQDDEMIYIRPSQIPLLSHEYILDDDPSYDGKPYKNRSNFELRKGAGDIYALGGRNFGKTAISQKVDLLLRLFLCENQRIAFSSYDFIHIKGVLEEIIPPLRHHPILSLFMISGAGAIVRSPDYRFSTKNGNTLVSINMNIVGKEPGKTFVQKHVHVLYIDEASMETEEVYKLRRDSVSEIGCIFRLSGMTNFTRYTPCGRIFYDSSKKGQIINHPQYVNPNWNDKSKEQAIKDFSGESSMGFRVFIRGEIVEDGVSVFDMERVKKCLAKGTKILMSDFSVKNIEDVNIGEKILTFDEFPDTKYRYFKESTVLNKFYQGKKIVNDYQIGNNILSSTFDHLVLGNLYAKCPDVWGNIKQFEFSNRSVFSLNNFISNNKRFLEGVLIGLIDSDGTKSDKYTYIIYQKSEEKAVDWLLQELNIKFTKRFDGSLYVYNLLAKNKKFIDSLYVNLYSDKNLQLGYLSGFIIGDGCLERFGFSIAQRKIDMVCRLRDILKLLEVKYRENYSPKNNIYSFSISTFEILPYIKNSYKVDGFKNRILKNGTLLTVGRKNVKKISDDYKIDTYDLTTSSGTFIANGILVHNCYDDRKTVKYFEVNKDTFVNFKYDIFVEKPKNTSLTYIFADIGETAPTEIGIAFKIGEKYRYFYNITLFNLMHLEQVEVFKWLGEQLSANYIGLDVTDGTGRAIFRSLELVIPRENLVWCQFNEKLPIDFEKNENTGEVLFKDGKPVYKEEYVSEWSVKHLKDLFYSEKMIIPMDYKLDEQLNSVQEIRSSSKGQIHTRKIYKCICQTGDHLFQAFQVFAISHWLTEFLNSKVIVRKSHYKGI